MNRAFSISFDFDGRNYLALASVVQNETGVSYAVRLYDDYLQRIIPEGNVRYNNTDGYQLLSFNHPAAGRLMACISQSISDHLSACRVEIM
jgi:hypothetical protein